ncbi:mCG16770, isoform CRA_a [Mus musculus]|uniref:2810026P18Rik protein n=1 Tax=Mus musculus TaxID=10090 RepID=Q78H50_MOUSE|nr:2810026P18Rik protein [Mus musculus]EDL26539.1 mCG16770, isoform CRA_a [Mus musculus]EDL26540.1 mCG16770, isoform CRA_a [Mus musculus]EDL26541.1 mCG16770, isoform CRA_a [Mus musculus]
MAPLFFASSKQLQEETKMEGSPKHLRELINERNMLKT